MSENEVVLPEGGICGECLGPYHGAGECPHDPECDNNDCLECFPLETRGCAGEPEGGYINQDTDGLFRVTLYGESVGDPFGEMTTAALVLGDAIRALPAEHGLVRVWFVDHNTGLRSQLPGLRAKG